MVQLGELMMILEVHRQGLSVTAIARRTGRDPESSAASRRRPIGQAQPDGPSSWHHIWIFRALSAARLTREILAIGYVGAYTAVKRYLAGDLARERAKTV